MKRNHTAKSKTIAATATAKLSGMARKAISMMQPKKTAAITPKTSQKKRIPRMISSAGRWRSSSARKSGRGKTIVAISATATITSQAAATKRQDFFR